MVARHWWMSQQRPLRRGLIFIQVGLVSYVAGASFRPREQVEPIRFASVFETWHPPSPRRGTSWARSQTRPHCSAQIILATPSDEDQAQEKWRLAWISTKSANPHWRQPTRGETRRTKQKLDFSMMRICSPKPWITVNSDKGSISQPQSVVWALSSGSAVPLIIPYPMIGHLIRGDPCFDGFENVDWRYHWTISTWRDNISSILQRNSMVEISIGGRLALAAVLILKYFYVQKRVKESGVRKKFAAWNGRSALSLPSSPLSLWWSGLTCLVHIVVLLVGLKLTLVNPHYHVPILRKRGVDSIVILTNHRVNTLLTDRFDPIRGLAVGFVIAYPLHARLSKAPLQIKYGMKDQSQWKSYLFYSNYWISSRPKY